MKVAVAGVCGRMGRTIARLVEEDPELILSAVTEAPESEWVGKNTKDALGLKTSLTIKDFWDEDDDFDVLIDFTTPTATMRNVEFCAQNGKKMVIGTTGLSKEQIDAISKAAQSTAIVFSPNMSVGVNLLFKLVADVARILGEDYDVEIVEIHHRFKKDAPSGTALRLAENIAEALGRDLEEVGVYGRKGIVGERKKDEIGVFAVRAGDVVGEHTVIFATLGERVELTHRAHSRETFARGAIRAAKWVYHKESGLYSMWDVLGIK
ncbi:MAG: 4-hydroxy-tetrahydrodipicolinate reductase [Deferribacteres bacterium]|nr:4-hydroxy-tetrahydrodipicolinate reductase [Deferribacteres bacterium]